MAFRMLACLFSLLGAAQLRPAPLSPDLAPPRVGVMLRFEREPSPAFLQLLQSEVGSIFRPSRLDLRWEILQSGRQPGTYNRVAVVQMHGTCAPTETRGTSSGSLRLGWTAVNEGEVLPYATIDCDQIARVLASSRNPSVNRQLWPTIYARLAGRVLAHELIHVLLRSPEHSDSDCARSPLRSIDLDLQARLSDAEVAALKQIGRRTGTAMARVDNQ